MKHRTILSKYIPYEKIRQINTKGQQVRPQVRPSLYFKHIAQFYNKHSTVLIQHRTILSKYIPNGKISQINKKGQQVRPRLYFKHIAHFYNKIAQI